MQEEEKLLNLFKQACDRMDEKEREDNLLCCLDIPNDDVKLAVVSCLSHVPLSQFDSTEIQKLLRHVEGSQNIGTGKTELVLAVIFHIFGNMVGDASVQNENTVETFKSLYGERAIHLAINIMTTNQDRIVSDLDEEYEKTTLAISILNFLKFVSNDPNLSLELEKHGNVLKAVLFAE